MAVSITLSDVKPMIEQMGFTVPDAILTMLLAEANTATECMEANGYSENLQTLLLTYAVCRLASLNGAQKITSRHAPSGASQSFTYDSSGTDGLYDQILAWDKNNCLGFLPLSGTDVGFIMVVSGNKRRRR